MPGQSKSHAVLIIDDDDDITHALSTILGQAGYEVRRAADGDEGVRLAKNTRPDLILLDFMMPIKSGFDALAEIRREPFLRAVPIIVLTAFGQDIGRTYGLDDDIGLPRMQGFLEKPVEPNVLLERVAAALAGVSGAE